jgi:hypothetical protein
MKKRVLRAEFACCAPRHVRMSHVYYQHDGNRDYLGCGFVFVRIRVGVSVLGRFSVGNVSNGPLFQ